MVVALRSMAGDKYSALTLAFLVPLFVPLSTFVSLSKQNIDPDL